MDDRTESNKSAGSLEISDRCLVCCRCATHPKLNLSTSESSSSNTTANIDFERLTKATAKIFEHLLIPKENLVKVKNQECLLSFCPKCKIIVEEIMDLQKKAKILELQIEVKVETLGRIAINTRGDPVHKGIERHQKEVLDVFNTFKLHLIQNFLQGILPNTSVQLEKTVSANDITSGPQKSKTNSETVETENTAESSLQDDGPSDCIILEEALDKNIENEKVDTEEVVVPKFEDFNSKNDFFEVIAVPMYEMFKNTNNQKTSQRFENMEIVSLGAEENDVDQILTNHVILSSNDPCIMEETNTDSVGSQLETGRMADSQLATTTYPNYDHKSDEEITVEHKIWVGETEGDEDMNLVCNESQENNNVIVISASHDRFEQLLQRKPSETEPMESNTGERLSIKHKMRCRSRRRTTNSTSDDELLESMKNAEQLTLKMQLVLPAIDSDSSPSLSRIPPKRQKFDALTRLTNVENPIKSSSTSTSPLSMRDFLLEPDEVEKLKAFIEKQDYVENHRKLSEHYIELHDVAESHSNSNPLDRLPILTEGLDYFSCPFANCEFRAKIKRDKNPKQQLQNAVEARLKIIQHFRKSLSHLRERKKSFYNINITAVQVDSEGVRFYKCTKCGFKSFVDEDRPLPMVAPTRAITNAHNDLVDHFLCEHTFPWEKFPGLYKYGCYEKKCEDGNFLKCPYFKCDYYYKVQYSKSYYDLQEKSQNECQIAAYQLFTDHSISHNFNSVGFSDNNSFSFQSTKYKR